MARFSFYSLKFQNSYTWTPAIINIVLAPPESRILAIRVVAIDHKFFQPVVTITPIFLDKYNAL